MALDNAKNFAKGTVSAGYTSTDTTIVLNAGDGTKFPTPPFNAVWWNSTDYPDPSDDPNVEIVRVTAVATDTLTVTRTQEGTAATNKNTAGKTYKLLAGLTAKVLNTDLPQTLYTQTSIQAGDTLSGTSAANPAFASIATIPANFLQVGTVIELNAFGSMVTASGEQATPALFLDGGNAMTNWGRVYFNAIATAVGWRVNGQLICRTTGASGSAEIQCWADINNGTASNQTVACGYDFPNTATVTIDTTKSHTLGVGIVTSGLITGTTFVQRGLRVSKF